MNCTLAVACRGLHVACKLLQAIHRKLQTVAVLKPVKDLCAATGVHFYCSFGDAFNAVEDVHDDFF